MPHPLFEKHRATLDGALNAIRTRAYWSAYNEMPSPKVYGETAPEDGKRALRRFSANPLIWGSPDGRAGKAASIRPTTWRST